MPCLLAGYLNMMVILATSINFLPPGLRRQNDLTLYYAAYKSPKQWNWIAKLGLYKICLFFTVVHLVPLLVTLIPISLITSYIKKVGCLTPR